MGNNRLIRKSILCMFPACFAASIAGSMSLLADSLLAGSMISQLAIAALINNIILRGFGGETIALSIYTAVMGVFNFA